MSTEKGLALVVVALVGLLMNGCIHHETTLSAPAEPNSLATRLEAAREEPLVLRPGLGVARHQPGIAGEPPEITLHKKDVSGHALPSRTPEPSRRTSRSQREVTVTSSSKVYAAAGGVMSYGTTVAKE